MTTANESAVATLRRLVDICTDGVEGYRRAAEAVVDREAHRILTLNASEREEVAAELTRELGALGHPPPRPGSGGGAFSGWPRALGAPHADGGLLQECMRGERATIDAFAQALAAELPASARSTVQSQLGRVITAFERVNGAANQRGPETRAAGMT